MSYTLHLGDCLEVMPSIPTGSVDAIIADWPYGTTACKWDSVIPLEPLWKECKRVIKPGGAIVLFGGQPFTSALVMSNLEWFKYDCVWNKDAFANFAQVPNMPAIKHESILVFSSGGVAQNSKSKMVFNHQNAIEANIEKVYDYRPNSFIPGRSPKKHNGTQKLTNYDSSIINIPGLNGLTTANGRLHPTQKPVALMEYLIKTYTNPGDLVLDNTMGSGSTGEACLNTGRRFIGIEKDPGYFEVSQTRLKRVEQELREAQIAKERQPYLMAEVTA